MNNQNLQYWSRAITRELAHYCAENDTYTTIDEFDKLLSFYVYSIKTRRFFSIYSTDNNFKHLARPYLTS